MIVSHKYRFIFVKTRKTAGSSIEAALFPHLGPYDIITGSRRDGTPRLNCRDNITGHIGWRDLIKLVGQDTFFKYRKFTVERNSYEKAASDWLYHKLILKDTNLDLCDYINQIKPSDWTRYTMDNSPIFRILRYETLTEEFNQFCQDYGLPSVPIQEYNVKKNDLRVLPYREYYDINSINAVKGVFENEIRYFKYDYNLL